jgi:hypothetical protein
VLALLAMGIALQGGWSHGEEPKVALVLLLAAFLAAAGALSAFMATAQRLAMAWPFLLANLAALGCALYVLRRTV